MDFKMDLKEEVKTKLSSTGTVNDPLAGLD
jgi:hypothetical protein